MTTVVIMAAALLAFGPTLAGLVRGAVLIPLGLSVTVLAISRFMVRREGHRPGRCSSAYPTKQPNFNHQGSPLAGGPSFFALGGR